MKTLTRLLGLGVATAVLLSCSGAGEDVKQDATVTACTANDGAQPHAEGQIVNRSSKTSNFAIRVTFYDSSGNKVSEGLDAVTNVEPNATSPWQTTGTASAKGPIECKVTSVTRGVDPLE